MLNLNNALKLYEILAPHFPEYNSETDLLDFAGKILDDIINSGKHANYIDALAVMENITPEQVVQLDANDRVNKFMVDLVENDVVYLIEFCRNMNYA